MLLTLGLVLNTYLLSHDSFSQDYNMNDDYYSEDTPTGATDDYYSSLSSNDGAISDDYYTASSIDDYYSGDTPTGATDDYYSSLSSNDDEIQMPVMDLSQRDSTDSSSNEGASSTNDKTVTGDQITSKTTNLTPIDDVFCAANSFGCDDPMVKVTQQSNWQYCNPNSEKCQQKYWPSDKTCVTMITSPRNMECKTGDAERNANIDIGMKQCMNYMERAAKEANALCVKSRTETTITDQELNAAIQAKILNLGGSLKSQKQIVEVYDTSGMCANKIEDAINEASITCPYYYNED
ncbi:MAG TPA: hypothetical protein VFV86_02700 [Nitrososphaeraceae archaeon]|nr:hypothetical protein [Nitrososphaeraceae archaeon]